MFKFFQSELMKVFVNGQMNTFPRSIKLGVVFYVDVGTTPPSRKDLFTLRYLFTMLVFIYQHERIPSKLYNLFNVAYNNINSTLTLKRKLAWCLELTSVVYKWGIISRFVQKRLHDQILSLSSSISFVILGLTSLSQETDAGQILNFIS